MLHPRLSMLVLALVFLAACKSGEKAPDVSGLQAKTIVRRFDVDLFAIDTNQLPQGLQKLQQQYPQFFEQYMGYVLGIAPGNPQALAAFKSFVSSYRPVFDTANLVAAATLPTVEKDLQLGLKYMQYYFPGWKPESPFEIITFIGPMDAYEPFAIGDYGDVRTTTGVGIALQLHLGAKASIYESGRQEGLFFDYQTRRFTPDMMVVNAMKNVIEDAFPYNASSLNLVEDMVEKGKRLYALRKVLPGVPDSLQFGYSALQMKGCEVNEPLIWNYFVKNDLLYSKDPLLNQAYLKDGPKTQELGEGAPGYIGLFVGRKIVEAYMQQHPKTALADLMKLSAKAVFEGAGYKP